MRKLSEVSPDQVIETTEENDLKFRELLHKNGFKWRSGHSYIEEEVFFNKWKKGKCYNITERTTSDKAYYKMARKEILQASDFLEPKVTKKAVLFKGVDLNNAVVRCPNAGDGEKVVEFFKSKGINTRGSRGFRFGDDIYYGCHDGLFGWEISENISKHIHIFNLSEILEEKKTFPRRMLVWEHECEKPVPRIVLHDLGERFKYRFVAVIDIDEEEYLNGVNQNIRVSIWKHAKEIETTSMTVEEMRQELEKIKGTKIDVVS